MASSRPIILERSGAAVQVVRQLPRTDKEAHAATGRP